MRRRIKGRTMQGMYSAADSLRDSYEMGRDLNLERPGNNQVTVKASNNKYPGRYKKDTTTDI